MIKVSVKDKKGKTHTTKTRDLRGATHALLIHYGEIPASKMKMSLNYGKIKPSKTDVSLGTEKQLTKIAKHMLRTHPSAKYVTGGEIVKLNEKATMTNLFQVDRFAEASHAGQFRKYTTGETYIHHPRRVAVTVMETGEYLEPHKAEAVAAALLHDVVEDTPVTLETIENKFGGAIAELVEYLTDPRAEVGGLTRAERKQARFEKYSISSDLDPERLKFYRSLHTVKAADLLDNMPSIRENDQKFWKVYRAEGIKLLSALTLAPESLRAKVAEELGMHTLVNRHGDV